MSEACLAILAHEKAAPTIADFEPQWRKLNMDMRVFLPEGDKWTGGEVQHVYNYGESAHRGIPAYKRFCRVLESLLCTSHKEFVIAEYDTVKLTTAQPLVTPGHFSASFCATFGTDVERIVGRSVYFIALSPWCLDRKTAFSLLFAMQARLDSTLYEEWVAGYLDRWIASVALEAGIPCAKLTNALGWPHDIADIHAKIRAVGATWIHGWKSKQDFKDLWPTSQ